MNCVQRENPLYSREMTLKIVDDSKAGGMGPTVPRIRTHIMLYRKAMFNFVNPSADGGRQTKPVRPYSRIAIWPYGRTAVRPLRRILFYHPNLMKSEIGFSATPI